MATDRVPVDYLDLDLEILDGGSEREFLIRVKSEAGEVSLRAQFPFDKFALYKHLTDVEKAVARMRTAKRRLFGRSQQEVMEFGGALFEFVFGGRILAHYQNARQIAEQNGKGLRLRLRVQPPMLAALPWELLYDSDRDSFLATSKYSPIVRHPDLPIQISPLKATPPIRILAMVASPSDLDRLDVEHEKKQLNEAVSSLTERGIVELRWVAGGTWRDLRRELSRGPWHVFHFIGHGGFDDALDEGVIALLDEHGTKKRLLRASELATLLENERDLRLVILNSCEGARGSSNDVFASTAATLIRKGIPGVIAMQYEISDEAALEFARSFYDSLFSEGQPVDAAVTYARTGIKVELSGTVEWATPVLYMRSKNGMLFSITQAVTPRPESANRRPVDLVQEPADRNERIESERRLEAERRQEAERKARDAAEQEEREKQELERKTREQADRREREEAERKAREEARRREQADAERKAQEEAQRKAQEEAERKAREEARRREQAETERKAREEAQRKAQQEAEHKAREEAKRREQADAERKAREEAQLKAQQEAERKAREDARRKERERDQRTAPDDKQSSGAWRALAVVGVVVGVVVAIGPFLGKGGEQTPVTYPPPPDPGPVINPSAPEPPKPSAVVSQDDAWKAAVTRLLHAVAEKQSSLYTGYLNDLRHIEKPSRPTPEAVRLAESENKRGHSEFNAQRWGAAADYYDSAHKLDPSNSEYANNAGTAKYRAGDLPTAEKYFIRAIVLQHERSLAWRELGILKLNQRQADQAAAAFVLSLKLASNPESARKPLQSLLFREQVEKEVQDKVEVLWQWAQSAS